jgi:hypothetical protein
MNRIIREIIAAAKETPYVYFAPLIGAYKGIVREYELLARYERIKLVRHRRNES